jgi:hypothetical protein
MTHAGASALMSPHVCTPDCRYKTIRIFSPNVTMLYVCRHRSEQSPALLAKANAANVRSRGRHHVHDAYFLHSKKTADCARVLFCQTQEKRQLQTNLHTCTKSPSRKETPSWPAAPPKTFFARARVQMPVCKPPFHRARANSAFKKLKSNRALCAASKEEGATEVEL